MSSISKAELRVRILQQLGVLAAGETASAEDASVVDAAIEAFHEGELKKFGTPSFATSATPEWAQDAMRDCVALRLVQVFGTPSQRIAELSQASAAGIALLVRHMLAVTPETTKEDLRNQVLQHLRVIRPGEVAPAALSKTVETAIDNTLSQLQAHDVVTFTATTIPAWAMLPLRNYIAYSVASACGADPGLGPQLLADQRMGFLELKKQHAGRKNAEPVKAVYY